MTHGMVPARFGGLVKNTLWDIVLASAPAPSARSTPSERVVYRVVQDLHKNPVRGVGDSSNFELKKRD
jgi:hypothetical protein